MLAYSVSPLADLSMSYLDLDVLAIAIMPRISLPA